MSDKKKVFGYDRLDLRVAHREYGTASRWIDFATYVAGIVLGILVYNLI